MNIPKRIVLTAFFPIFFTAGYAQADTLVLSPVNNPALNEYNLRRMAVDKNNNLWFGTDKGIVKFDGNDLMMFDKSDTMPANNDQFSFS